MTSHPDSRIVHIFSRDEWAEPHREHLQVAEQLQVDPDEAYRDAIYAEIRAVLFGTACGLVVGMLATVGLAYVWSLFL